MRFGAQGLSTHCEVRSTDMTVGEILHWEDVVITVVDIHVVRNGFFEFRGKDAIREQFLVAGLSWC